MAMSRRRRKHDSKSEAARQFVENSRSMDGETDGLGINRPGQVTGSEAGCVDPSPQGLFGDLGTVDSEAAPPRPGRSAITPAWVKQLQDSNAFQTAVKLAPIPAKDLDRTAEKAIAACRLLVDSGGRASSRSLAQVTDVALTRIDGLMSRITSILNAEGETCLRKDAATDAYVLDVHRMQLVFQVSLKKR